MPLGDGRPETTLGVAAASGAASGQSGASSSDGQETATSTASTPTAAVPTSTHSANETVYQGRRWRAASLLGFFLVGTLAYVAFLRRKRARDKSGDLQLQGAGEDRKGSSGWQERLTTGAPARELYEPITYQRSESPVDHELTDLRVHERGQVSDAVVQ